MGAWGRRWGLEIEWDPREHGEDMECVLWFPGELVSGI